MTDIFDSMSRDELIWWAKNNCYPSRVLKKSELLFYRWGMASNKVQKLASEHSAKARTYLELALKYQDLIRKVQLETVPSKAISYLDEAKKISCKIEAYNKEYDTVVKKAYREADRLYAEFKKTQDEEAGNARP
jgi:hypothetical protein